MRRSRVKAMVSTVAVVVIVVAGSARLRHFENPGHTIGKAASRSAAPSCLSDSADEAPLPASAPIAPPSHRAGIVHVREAALPNHVFEVRLHIRPPPSA